MAEARLPESVVTARKRLLAVERRHMALARRDPRFTIALEFAHDYGTLGLDAVRESWGRRVDCMEESVGGGE